MNCDWVKSNITLYIYDELGDDARYELDQHVGRCADCAAELKNLQEFRAQMSTFPVVEPSPNLLTASRMRLQEALESVEQRRGWFFDPAAWLRQFKFSPALAAALLIVGFAGGVGTAWKLATGTRGGSGLPGVTSTPAAANEASIVGIRDIAQQPGSNNVKITYDTMVPQSAEGSLNDARIQQLLLFAARNNYNSGVRVDSVDLLSQKPDDVNIRKALIVSLLTDNNPGVRLKALAALGPWVKEDVDVRNATLEALRRDKNLGVRAEALHLLQPVKADSTVRAVLAQLAQSDDNEFIRQQSGRILASVPEIQ
ncbi:MAG TPA: HEAT repeat domain-containing protein [Terriglobales bacterium]|nr:HEAT repeat domain-containing protein [Terriglobales bacterium]